MILRIAIAIFSAVLLSACTDVAPTEREVSIAYLKSLCSGNHYRIVDDYIIRGVVVATDWLGETNKSAVVVDESGGLEFAIDSRDISRRLPVYSRISIFCNGLMLSRIGGKIELGAPPTGDFPLGSINDEMFDRYIRIEGVEENFTAPTKLFSEISIGDIGNILRFDNLHIAEADGEVRWCDTLDGEVVTTYRTLIDKENNTLPLRTLSTCDYALERMPENEISAIGIIDYADDRYFLRIVNKMIIQ